MYEIVPSKNSGERVVGLSVLLRNEGIRYDASGVKERTELMPLLTVLNIETKMAILGTISSFAINVSQYICFAAEPTDMPIIMSDWRGNPSATVGAELGNARGIERALSRGSASPLATMEY